MDFSNHEIVDLYQNKYILRKKINEGGFGCLYSVNNKHNKKINNLVIKVALVNDIFSERGFYLKYRKLSDNCILDLFSHGRFFYEEEEYIFLIFPRLHYTIKKALTKIDKDKQKDFINHVAVSVFTALEFLHNKNTIHADIKDDNIMLDKYTNKIYLIDFNVRQKKSNKNTKISPTNFNGSLRYASINAHKGIYFEENDFESFLYNLVEWKINDRILPWANNNEEIVKITKKIQNKMIASKEIFLKHFDVIIADKQLIKFKNKIKSFDFEKEKSYDEFKAIFKK